MLVICSRAIFILNNTSKTELYVTEFSNERRSIASPNRENLKGNPFNETPNGSFERVSINMENLRRGI